MPRHRERTRVRMCVRVYVCVREHACVCAQVGQMVAAHGKQWQDDDTEVIAELCHALLTRVLEYKQGFEPPRRRKHGISVHDVVACYRIAAKFLVGHAQAQERMQKTVPMCRMKQQRYVAHEKAVLAALDWRIWDAYRGVQRLLASLRGVAVGGSGV